MSFLTQNYRYDEKHNSFLDSVFGLGKRQDIVGPSQLILNSLTSISGLYLYSNPPPMAYGTPGPKVIESVKRAYEFNLKPDNKVLGIGPYHIDDIIWIPERDGKFPYHKVGSNILPGVTHKMDAEFLKENFQAIDSTAQETIDEFLSKNSSDLTKGNQTWCPLAYSSLPCATAYKNACDFLERNGYPNHHTLIEFIQYFIELGTKEVVHGKALTYRIIETTEFRSGQRLKKVKRIRKIIDKDYSGEEARVYMMGLIRSFCSYLKHAERAHLQRRAIASPSVFLRAFLLLTETFHLKLGKLVKGSTISIGGEEKKAKIVQTMSSAGFVLGAKVSLQATEDATKWNECLSSQGFGMMTETFFNETVREEMGLPDVTHEVQLFHKLMMMGHFFLGIKRITIGAGVMGFGDKIHGHMEYTFENLNRFNEKFRPQVQWVLGQISDSIYIEASPGMLMGMHNAGSTTRGLTPVGYKFDHKDAVNQLRSSDDSMTLFTGNDFEHTLQLIKIQKMNHRCVGINSSTKKTVIYLAGTGEYTSWYQDETMVAQYGAEVTTMRPGGKNPPDDFYGIMKSVSVSQLQLESNFLGAAIKIRLGVLNVRSLYKIKNREDQGVIPNKVRVMADGGSCVYDITNCHLEETSLKEYLAETQESLDYFYKIRDPTNPFNSRLENEIVFDPTLGSLAVSAVETPRTIFHFIKKSNRSVTNIKGPTNADSEKAHAEASKILLETDVSLNLRVPGHSTKCADHVISMLKMMKSKSNLTIRGLSVYNQAINRLRGIMPDSDEDEDGYSLDDEDF